MQQPAPDLTLPTLAGDTFQSSTSRGKVLVLDFWATWCQPCQASFPRLDAMYRKHRTEGLEVVAVNEDEDAGDVVRFVGRSGVSFVVARDEAGKAAESFGVDAMPSTFVVDRAGVVRYVHSGYHPDDSDQMEREVEGLLLERP